ncbi:MAG: Hpt domain-containing protein [Lachnospiraceae bacterium]|jgi:HPt (histidine-containing phosphotransfer) domain-containing protein|nr:Hpt domain-containing protein [Lachnospiraceae bacterium]
MNIYIPGVDVNQAIKNSGSTELFLDLLNDVYKLMDEKCNQVETYLRENDLENYTILVHSLKTACRMIGAMELGEDFFTLEKLGKEKQLLQLQEKTPEILDTFRALKSYLAPYVAKSDGAQTEFDPKAITTLLDQLQNAIDDFDLSLAEDITGQLLRYHCESCLYEKFETLSQLVTNLDYEEAKELASDCSKIIRNQSDCLFFT